HTHMQSLLPKIEAILAALARESIATSDPDLIRRVCDGIVQYLRQTKSGGVQWGTSWSVISTGEMQRQMASDNAVTLLLHRVERLAELLELHFILSFWSQTSDREHMLAGWVMRELERVPMIPTHFFADGAADCGCDVKIRSSDEDARQVWKM